MGNQGQNMFTILMSAIEFCFQKCVRMIYFLVIKQLNMSKNFKIGDYVYTEKKYTCVKLIVISKQKINEEKWV